MKKRIALLLASVLLTFTSCGGAGPLGIDDFPDVGGDWHVTGLYNFYELDDIGIAVCQAISDGTFVGFEIWQDNDNTNMSGPSDYFGDILFADAGYTGDDVVQEEGLYIEDHNGDGLSDIGVAMNDGGICWYVQEKSETSRQFPFAEVLYPDSVG